MTEIRGRFRHQLGTFCLEVDFQASGQGITALFGPSGSGKTSLLRCMAGLEHAPGGYLQVNGEFWQNDAQALFLPPHRRTLGYVSQEASLFPHLSVRGNLLYGLRRIPPEQRRIPFEQAVELLGVAPLLNNGTTRLSGGERQRVAIARALLTSPRLLLMDEPLAALDASSKAEILPYLERLHEELTISMFYVSHDLEEVVRIADDMLYLEEGRLRAAGSLADLLLRLDLPLSRGHDAVAVLHTVVSVHDDPYFLTRLDFPGGHINVSRQPYPVGRRVRVHIHARDVSITLRQSSDTSILNILPTRILEMVEVEEGQTMLKLGIDGLGQTAALLARITRKSSIGLGLRVGMQVYAQIKSVALLD